jgi:hypothetical protein
MSGSARLMAKGSRLPLLAMNRHPVARIRLPLYARKQTLSWLSLTSGYGPKLLFSTLRFTVARSGVGSAAPIRTVRVISVTNDLPASGCKSYYRFCQKIGDVNIICW